MVEFFQNVFVGFRLIDVLDIVIVAYLVYKILGFIQETRAQQLVRGLVVLGIVFFLSDFLKLYLLNWLLRNFVTMGLFALIVLFQPELRRGLEQLGRRNIVSGQFRSLDKENAIEVVKEIVAAVDDFSATRTGALIVFERETMLNDIIETGTIVDARISVRLLGNLFYEGSPLHDGAVIIRGDRIHAASCVLLLRKKEYRPKPGYAVSSGSGRVGGVRCAGNRCIGGDRRDFGGGKRKLPSIHGFEIGRENTPGGIYAAGGDFPGADDTDAEASSEGGNAGWRIIGK